MNLPYKLEKIKEEIKRNAIGYDLDFFETIFEVLSYEDMNQVASYGGFPTRYPHWSFGMEYDSISKGYAYGLSKIYEMVINNDPCYAYLLECNNLVANKTVIAHVYGHCDFFKNNFWFSKTNRKMIDEMANHGSKIASYMEKYGIEEVEGFIDTCLSIDNLIDANKPFIPQKRENIKTKEEIIEERIKKLRSKDYMNSYINPAEFMEEQKRKILSEIESESGKFPQSPTRDVLGFLLGYAPLSNWQQDIISIIREESLYYSPQGRTKIMNEGWATFWHSKIMTEKALHPSELIDYADQHSGTLSGGRGSLNPYKLGVELFRSIKERWDRGQFGKEYDDCDDIVERKNWDKKLGLGTKKIFEVRKLHNDVTFIDEFLTEDFVREQGLFTYDYNPKSRMYEISSRDFKMIKQKLLFALTNFGNPIITVLDANYGNRGELYLNHIHEGVDVQLSYAEEAMKCIYKLWTRPVHFETIYGEKGLIITFDGNEFKKKEGKN